MTKKRRRTTAPLSPRRRAGADRLQSGRREPYGIRWFGSTALVGPPAAPRRRDGWRPGSSTRATGCAPSRRPTCCAKWRACSRRRGDGSTLTERLGRDVWIDFVADTGDDSDVSSAVAGMVFARVRAAGRVRPGAAARRPADLRRRHRVSAELGAGDRPPPHAPVEPRAARQGPPVAGAGAARHPGQPRLVRRPRRVRAPVPARPAARARRSRRRMRRWSEQLRRADSASPAESGRAIGRIYHQLHLDELAGSLDAAEQDAVAGRSPCSPGRKVKRISRLWLIGYRAGAGSVVLAAAPRARTSTCGASIAQLRTMDFRQRLFFNERRRRAARPARRILVSPDPAIAMGERNRPGAEILKACGLTLKSDPTCYLTGDSHHYERRVVGPSMHVIAGGGGAFVHGTRVHRYPRGKEPACAFPDAEDQPPPRRQRAVPAGARHRRPAAARPVCAAWRRSSSGRSAPAPVAGLDRHGARRRPGACSSCTRRCVKRRERPWASLAVALAHGPAARARPAGRRLAALRA